MKHYNLDISTICNFFMKNLHKYLNVYKKFKNNLSYTLYCVGMLVNITNSVPELFLMSEERINEVQDIIKYHGFYNVILKLSSGFMADVSKVLLLRFIKYIYITHVLVCILQNSVILNVQLIYNV